MISEKSTVFVVAGFEGRDSEGRDSDTQLIQIQSPEAHKLISYVEWLLCGFVPTCFMKNCLRNAEMLVSEWWMLE